MASAIDWQLVEQEYVTGPDTVDHKSLAAKHGVSFRTVQTHSSGEKWAGKRDRFREKLAERVDEKTLESRADDLVATNHEMGDLFLEAARLHVERSKKAGKARDAKDLITAAAIGFDKWRLASGQTTGKTEQIAPAPIALPVFAEDDPLNHLEEAAPDCDSEDDGQATS